MPIECKEIEYCKIHVHYTADPALVEDKRDEALFLMKKSKVKVPGFRAGKASDTAIKVKLKKHIDNWVQRELVSAAYDEVLHETQMKPIGYPDISNVVIDDTEFHCDMLFMKKPDFELQEYDGIEVPKPHMESTSTELTEKMIQDLRERHGDVVPYGENDFVQKGDQVTLDFFAYLNGEKVEEISSEGLLVKAGTSPIPEFDDNIMGMSPGEKREFRLKLTKENLTEHGLDKDLFEKLMDSVIDCHAHVHMGTKMIPCALDDEFAKKLNYETYDELRTAVEGSASGQIKMQEEQLISQQLIRKLVDAHDFEVPTWLVLMEAQQVAAKDGIDWNKVSDEEKDNFNKRAKRNVKFSLIMDSIREEEPDVNFSDRELIESFKRHLMSSGRSQEDADMIISMSQKDGTLVGMLASLRNDATLKWLTTKAKIIE